MEKSKPRVSIGIPVYNGDQFVAEAIESILAQTYTDFEFIISDNASDDKTQEICRAYAAKDPRICYYRNETNLGAAPNYNRVFELASGQYFKWADYDDLIAPTFLAECIKVMDQDPAIALCYPLPRVINAAGDALWDYDFKTDTSSSRPEVRFANIVRYAEKAYQVSGLIRSSMVQKTSLHGSYPSSDLVFLAELALMGRFFEIPERLFLPREHSAQSTKGAMAAERSRVVFFDTSNKDKIVMPKWMLLRGYMAAIKSGPISWKARLYCYGQMLIWLMKPAHIRALGKDLLLAIRKYVTGK
jgi:glycosyltransferase involved in cell wall biosynthesis